MSEPAGASRAGPARTPGAAPALAASVAAAAGYLLSLAHVSYDDAYIVFRYAARLASGRGFTYNDGEHILGVTTPLWTLLLAALAPLAPPPAAAGVLSALAVASTGLVLAWRQPTWTALALPLLMGSSPTLVAAAGGEMALTVLLAALAFAAAMSGREVLALGAASLAFLARPDALLVAAIAVTVLWRATGRAPRRGLVAFGAIAAPWILYAWITFGAPWPRTLAAKRLQAEIGWQVGFLRGLGSSEGRRIAGEPLLGGVPALAVLGVATLRRPGPGRLLCLWAALHAAALHALGIPWYHWYAVPVAAAVLWLAASGLQVLHDAVARRHRGIAAALTACVALAAVTGGVRSGERTRREAPMKWRNTYPEMGRHIAATAPPGARVAYHEVGYLGYHSGRHVIDLVGLVTRVDPDQLRRGNLASALIDHGADLAVVKDADPSFSGTLPERPWFRAAFRPAHRVGDLTLYRRVAPLPPPEIYGTYHREVTAHDDAVPRREHVVLELDGLAAIEVHLDTAGGTRAGAVDVEVSGRKGVTPVPAEDGWSRAELDGTSARAGTTVEIVVAAAGDVAVAPRIGLRRDGGLALRTVHRP